MEINRRTLLAGIGSTAAACLPHPAYSAVSCDVEADTSCRIFDSSHDLTKYVAKMPASTVLRFYSRLENLDTWRPNGGRYQNEVLTQDELKAIADKGMAIATVFQYFSGGSSGFHDEKKKTYDVIEAVKFAEKMKQPERSTLYFGADFALTPADIAVVKEYFEHAHEEVAKHNWKIGVYGCGKTCEILAEEGWEMDYWISASVSYWHTAEFFNSGNWTLFQTKTDLKDYGGIDTDILNPKFSSFGQWRPDGRPVSEPAAASQKIIDRRKFIQVDTLKLFSDPAHAVQPIALTGLDAARAKKGRSVRVLCKRGDFLGVSLDESDQPLGYCQASDLGTTIPHFRQDWEP
jgi:hypothetical protein